MNSGDKALKVINIIVVISFIIAPMLLAGNFFIQGEYGLGATFAGILAVFLFIYWKVGISYFEVTWLQKYKMQ
ncbi:hypothetical protein G3570_02430 [Balneolaceae bacterium YR4-1]|uniref:Uncharacterized protein n=1 Tax=Halalkalibaculum roseum TaxID=2709311 RepID=A0A6M1T558_9BACT|nr:hypothetical protein [Halalkalibaculum roseum]NGP75473.1 hypothetical protein [Halalkalibaculum roseum]